LKINPLQYKNAEADLLRKAIRRAQQLKSFSAAAAAESHSKKFCIKQSDRMKQWSEINKKSLVHIADLVMIYEKQRC
jgi:hypothetical protein